MKAGSSELVTRPVRPVFGRICIALIFCAAALTVVSCNKAASRSTAPSQNGEDPWRIGFYEGGPYVNYAEHLKAIVFGLQQLGWLEDFTFPPDIAPEDARSLWAYASIHGSSRYIEFVANAFWSADWDEGLRNRTRSDALARLSPDPDIDLILALGTWAGQDLANDEHGVPTIVLSTSDPVGAGIIDSVENSGHDHVLARVDQDRYERQLRLYYDIFKFRKLGVVYDDSPEGMLYSNIPMLRDLADALGFELVERNAPSSGISDEESVRSVRRAYEELSHIVDAQWIGAHRGESAQYLERILEPLLAEGIPTWAAEGARFVEHGALLSISRKDLSALGLWAAEIIARVLNGARPGELSQTFRNPDAVAINLSTARRIGFEPPEGLLDIADEIYE